MFFFFEVVVPCYSLDEFLPHEKPILAKGLELVKPSKWNAYFSFRNSVWEFWTTFQEFPFSRGNFRSGRKK